MKRIMIMTIVGVMFILSSCDLNKTPYNAVFVDDSFSTMTDAGYQRNGLYSYLRGRQLGVFVQTSEWQSDLFNAGVNFGNRGGFPHRLSTGLLDDYYVRDIWSNCYSALMQVNNFIEKIDNVATTTPAEETTLANYKAEAYYVRAFLYYTLIKNFGPDYEPTTAATALGVPLVTKFDIFDKPARATVKEIYDFILADITQAEQLTTAGAVRSERITIDAVKALKSKIQLLMHDFPGAAATAQALINSGKYPLITTAANLETYWTNDNGSEDIFLMYVSATEYGLAIQGSGSANTEQDMAPFSNWSAGNSAYWPDWFPTKTVMDMYEPGDFRLTAYYKYALSTGSDRIIANSTYCKNIYMLKKWPYTSLYGGNHRHKPKVARIAEQYLIAAEALALSGKQGEALTVLNTLRTNRGASALPAWDNQGLRNEWAREMIGEGVRMECLKRWGIGYNGRVPQIGASASTGAAVTIVTGPTDPDYCAMNAPANWYRFTLPMPQNDIRLNPNLVQTPEWVDPK